MDLFSYLLGKQSGGGGGGANLQEKTVKIKQDGTTVLTPDTGYDGFSKVTIITDTSGTLPSEFQRVEWIRSYQGNQYISTGVNASSELKLEFDIIASTIDGGGLYGGGVGWQNQYIQGEADLDSYFAYGNQTDNFRITSSSPAQVKLVQDKNVIIVNGVTKKTFSTASFETNVPVVLFAVNRNNVISEYGDYNLINCKIYDGDNIVRNFVPCYRKSDNEIGLYDVINDVFYTNQGTGVFLKGADVN